MAEYNSDFPFEIKELDPKSEEEINTYHTGKYVGYIQVGPKKYLLSAPYRQLAASIYSLPLRPSDTFVVTFPRSGTTWTQELVWLVLNDLDFAKAKSKLLIDRYVFLERSTLFFDVDSSEIRENKRYKHLVTPGHELLAATPSPRFIKSHLPLSLLPPSLLHTARVVYVARDPRDVIVSYYHFLKSFKIFSFTGDFNAFFDFFIKDKVRRTPFFEHLKEAWLQRHHPHMLFLFYEDLIKDLAGTAGRVAQFFGNEYSPQQLARLAEHLRFDNFKSNKAVTLEDTGLFEANTSLVRKGKAGDWRECLDAEQTERAARWMADNLRDTDLVFPDVS